MSRYVPAALRRFVTERAHGLCEYCLIHDRDTYFGCQVEHVIAVKHGGPSAADNLAFACPWCNRSKGSDLASISPTTGCLTRLFNPRTDAWSVHFKLDRATVVPLTEVGVVTAQVLDLNDADRLLERTRLLQEGRYPSLEAAAHMARAVAEP
jgi:hypothetical protein